MERSDILAAMGELKLYGMRGAYDGVHATAVKRQHEPQQVVGDLLKAEIDEKQARSIKYQMTIAKMPLAKDLEDFDFDVADINETLVRDLAAGGFIEHQRNVVLIRCPTGHCAAMSREGRHRDRQDPRRHRDRPRLHPPRRARALLQRRPLPGNGLQSKP